MDTIELLNKKGWLSIRELSIEQITSEICNMAIDKDPYLLKYIPNKLKTYELCYKACKKNGDMLEHVPDNLKTEELCILAIKMFAWSTNLFFVPIEKRTYNVCMEAVKQKNGGFSLIYVPEHLRTKKMCIEALKHKQKDTIKYVPDKYKYLAEEYLENEYWI